MGTKVCTVCCNRKPLTDFHLNRNTEDGHPTCCADCHNRTNRAHSLQRRYGMSEYQYEMMLKSQGNVCAVCGQPETYTLQGRVKALSVDHDHKTHKIRGLLCHHCNLGIGHFRDDPKLLRAAINYLEKHK